MLTEEILIPLIPELKKQAKRYTKDYEDLVQDTLLKAWANRNIFVDKDDKFVPLKMLCLIMRQLFLDSCKKESSDARNSMCYTMLHWKMTQTQPDQFHTVAIKECSKLPNFDFALSSAMGYSLEETTAKSDVKKTSVFKYTKQFQESKEEYV